jgi:hypothetical protein
MDTATATRALLGAIGDFTRVYENDQRFRDVLATLREVRADVDKLVPAASDRPDEESPGRRAAREAASERTPPERDGGGDRGYASDASGASSRK